MADTFSNDLRLRLQESGANSGQWGSLLNDTITNIASAFSLGSEAIPNASTHTITLADDSSSGDEARSLFLKCTGGGQACTVTLAPNTVSKVWIISNETSFTLTFSAGSGANVAVAAGAVKVIVTDGAGSGAAVVDALSGLAITGSTATFTTSDNSTQLTLKSTDADANAGPVFDMVRDSASPADSDVLGRIRFRADNDAGEETTMVYLQTYLHDASDGSEDGGLDLFARLAGSLTRRITINSSGEICFNEDSNDIDFRVESDSNTHMLFVDAGNNRVGINTSAPSQPFHVDATGGTTAALFDNNGTNGDVVRVAKNGTDVLKIRAEGTADLALDANGGSFIFKEGGTERMRLTSTGLGIGTSSVDRPLHIAGNPAMMLLEDTGGATNDKRAQLQVDSGVFEINSRNDDNSSRVDNIFTADLGTGNIGIGTSSMTELLEIHGDTPAIKLRDTSAHSAGTGPSINFQGLDSGSSIRAFAEISGVSTSGSNAGELTFSTRQSGSVSERMRIASNGSVGIGTNSPTQKKSSTTLQVNGNIALGDGNSTGLIAFGDVASTNANVAIFRGASGPYSDTDGNSLNISAYQDVVFMTGNAEIASQSERARIDVSGNLLVGTTSSSNTSGSGVKISKPSSDGKIMVVGATSTDSQDGYQLYSTGASAFRFFVQYTGQINATSTSINGISDVSLKENIRDLDKGLETILALQPRRFDWKNGDGNDIMGFVAQEVKTVLPELVHDYKYNHQETKLGLKMGDMIPTLVKAIQEQQATITALTARIEQLEDN